MSESLPELRSPTTRRHEEAVDAAARAAAAKGFSEAVFRDSVEGVRDDVDGYQRALHVVERREVKLRVTPAEGRAKEQRPLPSPDGVDPWTVDVAALPSSTRVTGWCPSCLGSGATKCAACRGAGKVKCARCEGRGVDAQGAGCTQCDGLKKLPCGDCKGGQVECADCKGRGEVTAWLEVERTTRREVVVHPMGSAARAHPQVTEQADFDLEPSRWPATLVEDTGMRAPTDLPAGLMPRLSRAERVVSVRVQRFQTVRHLVSYATALATGLVPVAGAPPEVDPTADWRPLELRRNVSVAAVVVLAAVAAVVGMGWSSRHAWYARAGDGPAVTALALALAVALTLTLSGALLTGRARTPLRLWVPASALMLLTGALALVTSRSRPRASHAEAALARGDVEGARVEADALRALDVDRAAGEALLDRIHLAQVRGRDEALARRIARAKEPWFREAARDEAMRALGAELARRAEEPAVRNDPEALAALADTAREVDPRLRERLSKTASLLRATRCADAGDLPCAREQTTRAVSHGADAGEAGALLQRAQARAVERFRDEVARAERGDDAAARLRAAIELSERITELTREPTDPTVDALRQRLSRATPSPEAERAPRRRHR